MPETTKNWHNLKVAAVFKFLNSSSGGLTSAQAKNRQSTYGKMNCQKKGPSLTLRYLLVNLSRRWFIFF